MRVSLIARGGGDGARRSDRLCCQVLAPYILTALIERPNRLVYVSSGMHRGVRPRMDDLLWTKRSWSGSSAYAESKLCEVLLAFAVARPWQRRQIQRAGAWMGGDKDGRALQRRTICHQGCVTQAWLATSEDELARSSGGYFYHQRPRAPKPDRGRPQDLRRSCWLSAADLRSASRLTALRNEHRPGFAGLMELDHSQFATTASFGDAGCDRLCGCRGRDPAMEPRARREFSLHGG